MSLSGYSESAIKEAVIYPLLLTYIQRMRPGKTSGQPEVKLMWGLRIYKEYAYMV
jgi:hypothetical protein